MCLSPIFIENPNYRPSHFRSGCYSPVGGRFLKDVSCARIPVPCGVCAECLQARQGRMVQKALNESLDHYSFFGTLTYKNSMLPSITLNGNRYNYADISHFQKMFKRLRKLPLIASRDPKYIVCTEFGSSKHRPHFHFILFLSILPGDSPSTPLNIESDLYDLIRSEWRVNVGSTRKPIYQPLFEFHSKFKSGRLFTNYDLHYINPLSSDGGSLDVVYYVSKYLLKPSTYTNFLHERLYSDYLAVYGDYVELNQLADLPPDFLEQTSRPWTFIQLWNIIRPKVISSKNFGYHTSRQKDYIDECLSLSESHKCVTPNYINPVTGKMSPLSGYFAKRVLTPSQQLDYLSRRNLSSEFDSFIPYHFKLNASSIQSKFLNMRSKISDKNLLLFDD